MSLSYADQLAIVESHIAELSADLRITDKHRAKLLERFREVEAALRQGTLTEDGWELHLLRWISYQSIATGHVTYVDDDDIVTGAF